MHRIQNVTMDQYHEVRIRHKKMRAAPPGEERTMTSYWLAMQPCFLGNHAWQLKSYYGSLSRSLSRLVTFIKITANINAKNLSVYKYC